MYYTVAISEYQMYLVRMHEQERFWNQKMAEKDLNTIFVTQGKEIKRH